MGLCQPDRWTCPFCHVTEVPRARDAAGLHRAIRRAQERHALQHGDRRAVAARVATEVSNARGRE